MSQFLRNGFNLEQKSSHVYHAASRSEWTMGSVVLGGAVAALFYYVAETHMKTTLAKYNQGDLLSLHIQFLLYCSEDDIQVKVRDVKLGKGQCTLQLEAYQENQIKSMAIITTINFDNPIGPDAKAPSWQLYPPAPPPPDFDRITKGESDDHWIAFRVKDQLLTLANRKLNLNPKKPRSSEGIFEYWMRFDQDEFDESGRVDGLCTTLLTDLLPSISETLTNDHGAYSAKRMDRTLIEQDEKSPGQVAELITTLKDLKQNKAFDNTISIDIQYRRRIRDGLDWIYIRGQGSDVMNSRFCVDITICDSDMEVVCTSRNVNIAMDVNRRFKGEKSKSKI